MDLSSLALALNKSHQPRNSCWRVWPKARGEALAPSRVRWGVCGGAQPCSSPHAARPRAQRTEILHEKAKSPPSQERALGATEPAVRNCCFSSGTQMPASKLRPETAQRGVGQDAGLTMSASEHRATDGSFTQRAGEEGHGSYQVQGQGSGARTKDMQHGRLRAGTCQGPTQHPGCC